MQFLIIPLYCRLMATNVQLNKSKIEKVPRGIQGEKSRKDTASSVKIKEKVKI